jgi:hypothetical protein
MKSVELFRYGAEDIKPTDSLAILTHAAARGRGVEWPSVGRRDRSWQPTCRPALPATPSRIDVLTS